MACLENIAGDREIPDHPLVQQTIFDCLHEAMDIEGLEELLGRLERGELTTLARDLTEPSPLAADILNARPYAFLDDAPLEERRTQAVMSRRWLDPETANDLGALDPGAIDRVRGQAWPEPRDADELHDALVLHGFVTAAEGHVWLPWLDELRQAGRATLLAQRWWVAAERLAQMQALHHEAQSDPPLLLPPAMRKPWDSDEAAVELVRGRLEALGPTTCAALSASLGIDAEPALLSLENEGFVMRGAFSEPNQWCERRLLARIHRYTIRRLRREIEPVTQQVFMRFLLSWQHATPEKRLRGADGVRAVLEQLDGMEVAASAWETEILPLRSAEYDPTWLDAQCLSGRFCWARRTPSSSGRGPIRTTPITLSGRQRLPRWAGNR